MSKDTKESEHDKEIRIAKYVTFVEGKKFRDWVVNRKLDEGAFGKVYLVTHKDGTRKAALKAEPNEVDGGSAIKLEMTLLRDINAKGEQPHIPMVYHAAKHRNFSYMVMTLLGQNVEALRLKSGEGSEREHITFSVSTWIRLGIQALYALKVLHDFGYIHRDIKPNNFVMGHPTDGERSRLIFLLDFGMSRAYAFRSLKDDRWIARMARSVCDFRGTIQYCSPNAHFEKEQGRQDDIWSLFFILIEMHCGLPWQGIKEVPKMEAMKMNMKDEDVVQNLPRELRGIIPSLRKLEVYDRPDYLGIYNSMLAVMTRYKVGVDDPFDWEKAADHVILKPSKPPAWHDPVEYFKSDPINIHGAPSAADRKEDTGIPKRKRKEEHTREETKDDDGVTKTIDFSKMDNIVKPKSPLPHSPLPRSPVPK